MKRWHDSKLKLLITVRHLDKTDIRKSLISVNFHSEILRHKSNHHSHKQRRLPHILERDKIQAQTMSLPVSLTSEHLITSLILRCVQMGKPNGTSADWRVAPIGWLWLSGRRSRAIILSLGRDMLMSFLANSSPSSVFPPFPPSFFASRLQSQLPHQPTAAASCSLLPHLLLSSAWLSGLMNTSHHCFANYWFDPNNCWWLKCQYCMIKTRQTMSTRVLSMLFSSLNYACIQLNEYIKQPLTWLLLCVSF